MKFNWGTGIALFYSLFVLALVWQVYQSTTYDNALVSEHYYKDDLNYQQHYNKLVNNQQLTQDLVVIENEATQTLDLQFPTSLGAVDGTILLFCPSAEAEDHHLPVQPDSEGHQAIPLTGLKKGLWKAKIDWNAQGVAYYKEIALIL